MLIKILITLAVLLGVFLIVAAAQSNDYRIERKATVAASSSALFGRTNDQRNFVLWNPWLKLDPNAKITWSGPSSGVGAACSWQGNNQVGAGTSTITESKPNELVRFTSVWLAPMAGTNYVDLTFQPKGDQTEVTLAMYGPKNFVMKAMTVFMSCDKMMGPRLEQGLAELGAAAK